MFSTFKQRLLLGIYIFLILSIPVGAYLVSQNQVIKSRASEEKPKASVKPSPKVATPSAKLRSLVSEQDLKDLDSNSQSPTIATSFGPTLSLKVASEGKPPGRQATKLFVGIVEGTIYTNPKFLLSFSLDLPDSGLYDNLSLAGLTPGTRYTALLKGSAQIATSSAFVMSPTVTNLNEGQPVNLTTGDLNDDNVINSGDYSIVQRAFGSSSGSSNWNELADFNKDGIINIFDLGIITKNSGQIGASGVWTSPPSTASPSASLNQSIGSPQGSSGGYWIWIPGNQ